MLKPAILYKEELEKKFAEIVYSEEFYYYSGYQFCFEPPKINLESNNYQYAIIHNDKVVGYLAYSVDASTSTAYNFGWISFCPGDVVVVKDLYEEMKKLLAKFRRIEWRMVGGNKVQKIYDKFCFENGGQKLILHDAILDPDGNFRDSIIYEIVNKKGTYA